MVNVGSTAAWQNVWGPLIGIVGGGVIFCTAFITYVSKSSSQPVPNRENFNRNGGGVDVKTKSHHKLQNYVKNRTIRRTK